MDKETQPRLSPRLRTLWLTIAVALILLVASRPARAGEKVVQVHCAADRTWNTTCDFENIVDHEAHVCAKVRVDDVARETVSDAMCTVHLRPGQKQSIVAHFSGTQPSALCGTEGFSLCKMHVEQYSPSDSFFAGLGMLRNLLILVAVIGGIIGTIAWQRRLRRLIRDRPDYT